MTLAVLATGTKNSSKTFFTLLGLAQKILNVPGAAISPIAKLAEPVPLDFRKYPATPVPTEPMMPVAEKFKVKIELTSHKNQQALQTSAQAAALVEKFYMLAPEIQAKVAPFYRDQIHALDPHCAVDQVIVPMMPMPVAAPGMPQEAQGGGGAVQPQTGSTEQLGDAGADGSTPFSTQLTQSQNPKTGS